ncbi:MAG TPA: NifU family protein [Myxococcota bacterium]|nr:NifU family protein [Myxococcales bacterium]HPG28240.1 NifU family protein [Myxococcota bacterium]
MSAVEEVVRQYNAIVEPEGGRIELLSLVAGVLRVRYRPGTNEACADCVMSADALRDIMQDTIRTLEPSIETVDVVD